MEQTKEEHDAMCRKLVYEQHGVLLRYIDSSGEDGVIIGGEHPGRLTLYKVEYNEQAS